jgi:hypothetical protein
MEMVASRWDGERDCTIIALATVLGISYERAAELVDVPLDDRGALF